MDKPRKSDQWEGRVLYLAVVEGERDGLVEVKGGREGS